MRLIILTSIRRGYASRCLPVLCSNPNLQIVRVVFSHGVTTDRLSMLMRKAEKMVRIGLLGAMNGIRLRDWYADESARDLWEVCTDLKLDIVETGYINSERTRQLFRESSPDLGLSLGNGYIPSTVFSIPKHGMINVHAEVLPQFQGAYSIIWPIYENILETGFTIHQIDKHIDTGPILFQEKYAIELFPTLRETVSKNLEKARKRVPRAVAQVCENYTELRAEAKTQKRGNPYTTPTIWQFLRMKRNHRKMITNSNHS